MGLLSRADGVLGTDARDKEDTPQRLPSPLPRERPQAAENRASHGQGWCRW